MEARRKDLLNLALSAASVAACLAAFEMGTRLFADVGPSLIVKDPVVGKRYRAGFQGEVYVPEAGRRVALRFNRDGFRGPDRPYEKPPGVRRVAVLGDSMIVAAATDEEKTLVRRLEDMLNGADPAAAWEVMNFGISSSSTGQEMVLYREVASRYHPDIVVCAFYVGNDLADNSPRLTRAPRIYFDLDPSGALRQLPFRAPINPLTEWLDRNSRFYVWQKEALSRVRARIVSSAGRFDPTLLVFQDPETKDVAHAWTLTGRLLQAFRREVEAGGARFVAVALPSAEEVYDDLWKDVLTRAGASAFEFRRDHPERRLEALCRESGVTLVTMADDFRRAAPGASSENPAEWLFCSGKYHLNDAGNLLAAQMLHRFLVPLDRE
jgi:hypothetical protein